MELILKPYTYKILKENKDFLEKKAFEYKRKEEKILISEIIKAGIRNNTKIYTLNDSSNTVTNPIGMIAISTSKIPVNKHSVLPCIELDLLFINNKYRKQKLEELDKSTFGEDLLLRVISIAIKLSKQVGVRYLILTPMGHEKKLVEFYKKFGFEYIPTKIKEWMYLNIHKISK